MLFDLRDLDRKAARGECAARIEGINIGVELDAGTQVIEREGGSLGRHDIGLGNVIANLSPVIQAEGIPGCAGGAGPFNCSTILCRLTRSDGKRTGR